MPPVPEVTTQAASVERLRTVFGEDKLKDEDLEDYAKILKLLSRNRDFQSALDRLSAGLWDLYRAMAKEEKNKFSRSLVQFATTKAGFPQQHTTLLCAGADDYLGYIKSGLLLKDGMHAGHGEYSHTLQWLALACADLKFNRPIGDLYKMLGEQHLQGSKLEITTEGTAGKVSLWAYLVDAFPMYMSKKTDRDKGTDSLHTATYRSPQNVMKHLLAKQDKNHFLSTYLQRRYTKRDWFKKDESVRDNFQKATFGAALAGYTEQKYKDNANYDPIKNSERIVGFTQKGGAASQYSQEESARKHKDAFQEEVNFHGKPGIVYWLGSSRKAA